VDDATPGPALVFGTHTVGRCLIPNRSYVQSMTGSQSRRRFLAVAAGAGTAGLAGCLDTLGSLFRNNDAREDAEAGTDPYRVREAVPDDARLPLQHREMRTSHDIGAFESAAEWGGVEKDGIPPVEDPVLADADAGDAMLSPGDPVFGVALDGDARAYPQHILVRHEVVNESFGDRGVAVTYCPLTGTAVGFERGSVGLGVSGMLVNSNLVMYDRETDSWWPQILGTAVLGERRGLALREIRVTWTTWERWRTVHPDTRVLSEDTGQAFSYNSDPYGGYNPPSGYYADGDVQFPLLSEDDRLHPKAVVIGARSADGAVAFHKERLRDQRLLETTVGGVPYLAAHHPGLDSAWVYRNPESTSVAPGGEGYAVEDTVHPADDLPLPSVNAFDAMWFAWAAFYPETVLVD
jgi:hypothetical protein